MNYNTEKMQVKPENIRSFVLQLKDNKALIDILFNAGMFKNNVAIYPYHSFSHIYYNNEIMTIYFENTEVILEEQYTKNIVAEVAGMLSKKESTSYIDTLVTTMFEHENYGIISLIVDLKR